jgi:hypothetical protein
MNWRTRALIVGGAIGALLGVAAARLYTNAVNAAENERPEFNPAQAVTIGLAILGILRQIAALPEGKLEKRR